MKIAPPQRRQAQHLRSIVNLIPALSLVCLFVSRTVLHHTRYEDGVLGFGAGTLLAYVLADLVARFVPEAIQPRELGSNLQTLGLTH